MEIQWDVCRNNVEHQRILEDILPQNYHYQVTSFKIEELSPITAETKFDAQFNVNCCLHGVTGPYVLISWPKEKIKTIK